MYFFKIYDIILKLETGKTKETAKVDYLYETHLHTSEGSACAGASGSEQAGSYHKAGYSGIIVTDHFFNGNTAVPRNLPWKDRIELFCRGYENAKKEGDRIGLQVFFGWESGYHGTEFLVYGLDKEWLIDHDDMLDWSVEKQYEMVSAAGGMVIHAHPFREASYIPGIRLYPEYVDGVEAVNTSNDRFDPMFNKRAYEYALRHNLPMTGGSDVHNLPAMTGGMAFEERLSDICDFISRVKNKQGKILGLEE